MSDDLDRIDNQFRSQAYAVENPKKILKMDPDQGSNRGNNGFLTGGRQRSKEQNQGDLPDESEAGRPVTQSVDTVIVSQAAQRLLEQPDAEPAKEPELPSPATVAQKNDHHVDLTA